MEGMLTKWKAMRRASGGDFEETTQIVSRIFVI